MENVLYLCHNVSAPDDWRGIHSLSTKLANKDKNRLVQCQTQPFQMRLIMSLMILKFENVPANSTSWKTSNEMSSSRNDWQICEHYRDKRVLS